MSSIILVIFHAITGFRMVCETPVFRTAFNNQFGFLCFSRHHFQCIFRKLRLPYKKITDTVIIALTGYNEDLDKTYHGWVVSYDATTLKQKGIFCTTPTPPAKGGGIWMSGRAPIIDDQGYIYLFTANAFVPDFNNSNGYDGVNNFSESLLKFDTNLKLIDWFTPSSWPSFDANNYDFSASGPLLIPGTNFLTGGGKNGVIYLWDTNNLGKYVLNDKQVIQSFRMPLKFSHVYGGPVYWTRSAAAGGSLLFDFSSSTPIYAYSFNGSTFNPTPVSTSSSNEALSTGEHNAVALTANGDKSGTGIVWELQNAPGGVQKSVLRAFDAENLTNELWNSNIYLADSLNGSVIYVPPTIANGKVYANVYGGMMSVYGLDSLSIKQPLNKVSFSGIPTNVQISASDSNGDKLTYSALGLPPGFKINSSGLIWGNSTAVGQYNASVTVSNNRETPQTVNFTWVVAAAPSVNLPTPQSTILGSPVSLPIVASDNGLTIKYSATALPTGLNINTTTGVITGNPTKIGSFSPIITATNPYGQNSSVNFSWTVTSK